MYVNCHSYFSLKYGTLSPDALVEAAVARGVKTLALTDINNTSCSYAFVKACQTAGIKPVLGIEFREEGKLLYIGLARNNAGWHQLCRLLTEASLEGKSLEAAAPHMPDTFIIYPGLPKPLEQFSDNEFIGIRPGQVNKLFSSALRKHLEKLVAWAPVTFLDEQGFRTHKLLRCIDLNLVIGRLEPQHCARADEMFHTPAQHEAAYLPYPELLRQAVELLDNCSIDLQSSSQNNRKSFTGSKEGDVKLLNKLTINGQKRRYGMKNKAADERVKKELKVIAELDFPAYFLITWDIIRYATSLGYFHVGRGSGANSIVAYCLGITDVDPLELDLYFERFINPFRSSPPDFDIDFSWSDRDDVTDYIFKRYGKEHTALIATYNTFKGKSIIRELGKVFGLPKSDIDLIVQSPTAAETHHSLAKQIFHYGKLIEGFPNYLSIHAGGVIISETPLNDFTALQLMPKGFPITHFDMYGAEDLGFHKYDVLSQRGLGHIRDAVDLVKENRGKAVDIHAIDQIKEDPRVRSQLHSGNCIGCFYIESPAMRGLLHKLRCDDYIHLVAASSIIRPGVAKSGMMREYINRFHHPDSYEYLHPIFKEQLGETYGVMVYQEDVMKIVHHFAGLDLDESDILRRIMTGKKKSSDTFFKLREKFFVNCTARGYPDTLSQEVWRQVESFSGYSFCKAHSASFAVESFQSLYLKAYYPLEFMVAVINNFGGFYDTEMYVHETRMQGAKIHAPCVNNSRYLTHIQGNDVYIGMIHLNQLERKVAHDIVENRTLNGPFRSLEDFVYRIDLGAEQLQILIRIGAFRFTGMNKYELMWEKNAVFNPAEKHCYSGQFFEQNASQFTLPVLEEGPFDQAYDEIELLGFPLQSPFDLLEETPDKTIMAGDMEKCLGKRVRILGYYVTRKPVTTVNGQHMNFGTWVDAQGHFFDTTHFPISLKKYPLKGKGVYLITGTVVDDFGFKSIDADMAERLPYVKDKRY